MTFFQALSYLPFWSLGLVAFLIGACIGSFLNVIIYRIPIGPTKRMLGGVFNINTPRSHCPICQHQLAWYENLPLLSWAIQRARCRNCNTIIPSRYPAVELFVALVGVGSLYTTLSWATFVMAMTLSMALVPALWWLCTRTPWNRFMACWLFVMLLASMVFGGYVWIVN